MKSSRALRRRFDELIAEVDLRHADAARNFHEKEMWRQMHPLMLLFLKGAIRRLEAKPDPHQWTARDHLYIAIAYVATHDHLDDLR
ncbi:MAG: hypothetical protein K0U74_12130 [Alphaproteobacteria bacterium]|nr:hypothetical protein [Alphaproteobacteria bacterium]